MINENVNIAIFDNWALKDKDKGMEKGHASSVSSMLKIINNRTDILKNNFNFLDFGCGNGWVVRQFSNNSLCNLSVGVDGSKNMIQKSILKDSKGKYYETYMIDFDSVFMPKNKQDFYNNIIFDRGEQNYIWPPEINLISKRNSDYKRVGTDTRNIFSKYYKETKFSEYLEKVMIYLIGNMISRRIMTKLGNIYYPKLTAYILRMRERMPMKRPTIKNAIKYLQNISKEYDFHYDGNYDSNWFEVDELILYEHGLLKEVKKTVDTTEVKKTVDDFKVGAQVMVIVDEEEIGAIIIEINPKKQDEKRQGIYAPIKVKFHANKKDDWFELKYVNSI